jgi:hypothetical protein
MKVFLPLGIFKIKLNQMHNNYFYYDYSASFNGNKCFFSHFVIIMINR